MTEANRWRIQLPIAAVATAIVVLVAAAVYPRASYVVPDRGGEYVEALTGLPRAINPVLVAPDSADGDLARLIFNGLTRMNERGEPAPDLALSWQVTPDSRSYTFRLREDARWHDGAPFTAEDALFTFRLIQDPLFPGSPDLAQLWQSVRVTAPDEYTLRLELADPYAPILEFASIGILPAHLLRDVPAADLPAQLFNARPVGTGPFRVKAVSRDEILLEANDLYYSTRPYLATLRFRFYPDDRGATDAFVRGEAQGLRRLAPNLRSAVLPLEQATIHSGADLSKLTLLLFNMRRLPLADRAVRQAIAYGLDRRALINGVLGGAGVQANGPVSPVSWAYKADLRVYDYDPEAARALLDDAGWVENTAGVREQKGTTLSFVLLTNDKPLRIKAAEEIARQLAKIGIGVEVQRAGWTGFVQDFLAPHKFQVVLAEQWSPNFDPDGYAFWHSSQTTGGLNFGLWANRLADDLLADARHVADTQTRLALYDRFQTLFTDELPGIPLFYPLYEFPVDRGVRGVRLGPLVESANRLDSIASWFVKTKTQDKPRRTGFVD